MRKQGSPFIASISRITSELSGAAEMAGLLPGPLGIDTDEAFASTARKGFNPAVGRHRTRP
jgi:hypothetical protein